MTRDPKTLERLTSLLWRLPERCHVKLERETDPESGRRFISMCMLAEPPDGGWSGDLLWHPACARDDRVLVGVTALAGDEDAFWENSLAAIAEFAAKVRAGAYGEPGT